MRSSKIWKKSIIFVVTLLAVCTLAIGCSGGDEGDAPDGMKAAHVSAADYRVYVPSEWVVDTAENSLMASAHASETDRTNLTVMAYTGDRTYASLEEYFAAYRTGLEKMFDLDDDGKTTFSMLTDGDRCLLGGAAANKYVYSGKVGGVELKYEQIVSYFDGNYYLVTFTADVSLFDEHTDDFDQILQNFAFAKAPTTTASLTTTEAPK